MPWVYHNPKVYKSARYGGSWVSSLDHGTWVEEDFFSTWEKALEDALYKARWRSM